MPTNLVAIFYAMFSVLLSLLIWQILKLFVITKKPKFEFDSRFIDQVNDRSAFFKTIDDRSHGTNLAKLFRSQYIIWGYSIWILSAVFTFSISSPLFYLLILLGILLSIGLSGRLNNLAFFILVLAAVPDYIKVNTPFPGLENLLVLTYWKVAVISLILPNFILSNKNTKFIIKLDLVDYLVISFFVLISILTFRQFSFTEALRQSFDYFLLYIVIYFGLSRSLKSFKNFDECIISFFIVAILVTCIGIISQLIKWDFYQFANIWPQLFFEPYRWGFLRLNITTSVITNGVFLIFGTISLIYMWQLIKFPRIYLVLGIGIFLFAALFTGSRGIILGFSIAIIFYILLSLFGYRYFIILLILVFIPVSVYSIDLVSQIDKLNFDQLDEHGTFEYRAALLSTSIKYISKYPYFGDPFYLNSTEFSQLIQGQGIIDIVNTYLQIALEFGLVTLFLFCGIIITLIIKLLLLSRRMDEANEQIVMTLSMLFAFVAILGTTSAISVSLVMHLLIILLSLGRGLMSIKKE